MNNARNFIFITEKRVFHIATGSQMIDYRILLNDRAIMCQVVAAHYNAINPSIASSFPIFLLAVMRLWKMIVFSIHIQYIIIIVCSQYPL